MHATNYAESAIGSALFLGQQLPAITEWHIGLFSATASPETGNVTEVSTSGTGYARERIDPGASFAKRPMQDSNDNTVFYNTVDIAFNTAITIWAAGNYISHFGLYDQSGNLWIVAPLTSEKIVNVGDAPVFLAGELEITIG